jgi:hypothetical protein
MASNGYSAWLPSRDGYGAVTSTSFQVSFFSFARSP